MGSVFAVSDLTKKANIMSHELSIRANGKTEMAFVGETPWHGLGQNVTQGASLGVWAKEAGMDWRAVESPVFAFGAPAPAKEYGHEVINFSDHKALYRSDTQAPLSIVGAGYEVVQPLDVLEFFRDMTEQGGWHIHTAGVLRGGRKLWAMASNGDRGAIGSDGKDVVYPNLLLATSLDGSLRTTAKLTSVRVVCANTVSFALNGGGKAVTLSHRSVFDPSAIKRALGVAIDSFKVFMAAATEMAATPIDLDEAREVLDRVFQTQAIVKPALDLSWMSRLGDAPAIPDEVGKETRVVTAVLDLFEGAGRGATMKSSKGTRWGLLNAVTEQVDHNMGRSDDTRLDAAWFGRGDGFKNRAWSELVA